ncbi:MAG: hypothetical protein ABSD80_06665 [Caulobacteraceae bacterium]|jgi:hypothetical protein
MTDRRSALAYLLLAPLLPASAAFAAPKPKRPDDDDDDSTRGIPNMFISPCGEPFRAADGAPYPVVDWFKQADANGDDKVDRAEFRADADRFFKKLDLNGDGALSRYEITVYEHKWVPEILGGTVGVGFNDAAPRLWLAQYSGGPGPGGALGGVNASINPQGDKPMATPKAPEGLNETGVGASPYSFFDEPEPIMTADLNVNGLILRDNFLKVADMHFDSLDPDGRGYLTLKTLPQTTVEKLLNQSHHRKSSR